MQGEVAAEVLVRLRGLTKRFGGLVAVHPTDLDVMRGDFLAILGPSGCGKTSLLRMIAGFLQPSGGTIEIAGVDVSRLGPERRPTNMVFQGYGLFPHMNVRENVAYGLRVAKVAAAECAERVEEALALVHLESWADHPVTQLSGGQAQRVALARALIMRPQVLLLDEPLAALDLKLRKAMQEELRRIHRSIGGTFVFVTHNQEEAMELANRIVVMRDGHIVQVGSSVEIYRHPADRFVADFIGDANFLPGRRAAGTVSLEAGARFADPGPDGPVSVMVRPHAVRIAADQGPGLRVTGLVQDVVYLGQYVKCVADVNGAEIVAYTPDREGAATVRPGEPVALAWPMEDQVVLDDR